MKHLQFLLLLLFCSPENSLAQKRVGQKSRALVVGIGQYEDPALAPLPHPAREAELMAAWLRSPEGAGVAAENVRLLLDESASIANLLEALDQLTEDCRPGELVFLWVSGYAMESSGEQVLLCHDSPLADPRAGALPIEWFDDALAQLFRNLKADFAFFLNAHPLPAAETEGAALEVPTSFSKQKDFGLRQKGQDSPPEFFERQIAPVSKTETQKSLTDALLGEADQDDDQRIHAFELAGFLEKEADKLGSPMRLRCSSPTLLVSRYDPERIDFLQKKTANGQPISRLPRLIQSETTPLEDSILAVAGAVSLFQDFILAVRLGNLLEPPARNARQLLDSLLAHPEIQPLHSKMRRKLAAALQDETQQALNAYLKADGREMRRRREKNPQYALLPEYLRLANELLGKRHFLHNLLEAKRLYFVGLEFRFRGEGSSLDSAAIFQAMQTQCSALELLPEAPFIINEIGVLQHLLKDGGAEKSFFQAAQLAPRWSVPYFNLSQLASEQGRPNEAIRFANVAVAFSPDYIFALDNLGALLLQNGDLDLAEKHLRRAIGLDPHFANAWYNLGCLFALRGKPDDAFFYLENAVREGFSDWEHLNADPDLAPLRGLPRFRGLSENGRASGRD